MKFICVIGASLEFFIESGGNGREILNPYGENLVEKFFEKKSLLFQKQQEFKGVTKTAAYYAYR